MKMSFLEHAKDIGTKRANLAKIRTEYEGVSEKLKAAQYGHENARGIAILDGKELQEPAEIAELSARVAELDGLFQPANDSMEKHCHCVKLELLTKLSNAKTSCELKQSQRAMEIGRKIAALIVELAGVVGPSQANEAFSAQWLSRLVDERSAEIQSQRDTSLKAAGLRVEAAVTILQACPPQNVDAFISGNAEILKYVNENP